MALTVTLFLSALLLLPVLLAQSATEYPVTLVVQDTINNRQLLTYTTIIPYRAVLLGAMRKINQANPKNFRFETREDPNYGPFLVSVNGVAGNDTAHTYWQLLKADGTPTDVGVGCYIPEPNETVTLKFTTWD
ncbi:transcobalamin-1 [Amia ocellicauda]|uniref:transcobalamin-1 n=1 Tax=Amia ocellicauda TaxID=2972642 RepID=UPI003463FD2E